MFAMLGKIRFDSVRNGITDINHNKSVRYASHDVFKKKQRLQKIAPNIDDLSLTIHLHRKSGNVQARIDALDEMLNDQKPVSYMMGDGRFVGNFVVESMGVTTKVADDIGAIIEADIYLYLREFAGEIDELGGLSGLVGNAMGAIGAITAEINKGLGKVQDLFDDINDLVSVGRSMTGIGYKLQEMIGELRGANDQMQIINNMTPFLSQGLSDGETIAQNVEGWDEDAAQFGSFLDGADALLVSFEHVNIIVEESINEGELTKLDELEAVNMNIVSQSQTLNIESNYVLCDVGMRSF